MNSQVKAQTKGGQLLGKIKNKLKEFAAPGVKLEDIDQLALKLINQTGGQASFQMVPGYNWATCINTNHGIVHGIPKGTLKSGDLVTIDVGLFLDGYHTDTSTSFVIGKPTTVQSLFLQTGEATLKKAISQAIPGNHTWDISHVIQQNIESAGYSVVRNLTGHGVGINLHQEPAIPCFTKPKRSNTPKLHKNQALAIEVMYCQGHWQTITGPDNWTISTKDGKLSAVFEETVLVTNSRPKVVTAAT